MLRISVNDVSKVLWLSALLLAGCSLDAPRREVLAEGVPKSGDVVELEGVTVDRFEADRLASRASIARARVDRERDVIDGEGVDVRVLDAAGAETARIRAPRGAAELGAGNVVLEGGVVLEEREARTIRAEKMRYDASRDVVEAPGRVTIEGANFRAEGDGLVARRREGTIDVGGPATATVTPAR